jgi:hypothetical protein
VHPAESSRIRAGHPYDVTRDGRFLVNERVNTRNASFPLTVVLGWPALLSR